MKKDTSKTVSIPSAFAAVLLAFLVSSTSLAAEDTTPAHPIDVAMEKSMEANPSTGGQTDAIQIAGQAWDKELNQLYTEINKRLPVDSRNLFKQSQREWLQWRDKEAASIQSIYNLLEGSMWAPAQAYAEMNLTRERSLRLKHLLSILSERCGDIPDTPLEFSFPLTVFEKTLKVSANMGREAIVGFFKTTSPDVEPSLNTADRLQYDLQLVEGQASASLLFDFDSEGQLSHFLIDAFHSQQAPPVGALVSWLKKEGQPSSTPNQWSFGDWRFSHYHEEAAGEDSSYSIEGTR